MEVLLFNFMNCYKMAEVSTTAMKNTPYITCNITCNNLGHCFFEFSLTPNCPFVVFINCIYCTQREYF